MKPSNRKDPLREESSVTILRSVTLRKINDCDTANIMSARVYEICFKVGRWERRFYQIDGFCALTICQPYISKYNVPKVQKVRLEQALGLVIKPPA